MLLISLVGAMAALLAFAVVAQAGLAGVVAVPLLFTLVLLTRGVVFGLAWAATPATAQSYVADVTAGTAERVRGMSMIGAAQGLALGGLLSLGGLLVPIYVAPVIPALIAVLVGIGLPKPRRHTARPEAVRVSPFDRRMWPFLVTGFGLYLALAIVLMTAGFLVQDRLHLTTARTGPVTGLVVLAGAAMVILVQAVVVPRLGWAPARLIRVGAMVMTVGMVLVAFAPTGFLIGTGVAVLGAGMGFGTPGFMSAPTLLAMREEQGAVAGLVGASSALAFMLGPLLGTGLYEIAPAVPYLLGAVLLAGLSVVAFVHPGVRRDRRRSARSPGREVAQDIRPDDRHPVPRGLQDAQLLQLVEAPDQRASRNAGETRQILLRFVQDHFACRCPIRVVLQCQFQKDRGKALREIGTTRLQAKSIRLL